MRTSSPARNNRLQAGFTVLEMGAVLAIMALLATGVMLRLDAVTAGEDGRSLRQQMVRVATAARAEAVSQGRTVEVTYDSGGRRFTARVAEDPYPAPALSDSTPLAATAARPTANRAATTNTSASAESADQGPALAQIRVPETWEPGSWELEGQPDAADQWRLRFYADGSQDQGGVSFTGPGGAVWSWSVPSRGPARIIEGDLPPSEDETWPAGELEQRSG